MSSSALSDHIRRLSTQGSVLYIRIDNSDIARLGLRHGEAIEMDLGRARVFGIVKTSGDSPWLAPGLGFSNASITAALRQAGFDHGMDVPATIREPQSVEVSSKRSHAAKRSIVVPVGDITPGLPHDWAECVRQYNVGFYRGRSNTSLDREAYHRFAKGLFTDMNELTKQITFVGKEYGGAQ